MITIQTQKFLLDENVDRRLKDVFSEFSIDCSTLNDFSLNGKTNGELSSWVRSNDFVLVTQDRDFKEYWQIYDIKVVLLVIHTATLRSIINYMKSFLQNYSRTLHDVFLIQLTATGIVYQFKKS